VSVADVREAITKAHQEEWARVVAALTRRFRDLDIAEEAAAEAFSIAVERWPVDGVPPGNVNLIWPRGDGLIWPHLWVGRG
jgi:RNA polymerase sigma-70 factor (ECF subfamily)